jgi:ribosomal protein S20
MNKKQRNRKEIKKNRRNKLINRYYSSTLKTLLKSFFGKINQFSILSEMQEKEKKKNEIVFASRKIWSLLDKASQKKVIHKNFASRKKLKIMDGLSKL